MSKLIWVDRREFSLCLYRVYDEADEQPKLPKLVAQYEIGLGMRGHTTPRGAYAISQMVEHPSWTKPNEEWVAKEERGVVVPGGAPENPIKSRWMRLEPLEPNADDPERESIGIHGSAGATSGKVSHGCVRMEPEEVEDLYERVQIGDPVVIA